MDNVFHIGSPTPGKILLDLLHKEKDVESLICAYTDKEGEAYIHVANLSSQEAAYLHFVLGCNIASNMIQTVEVLDEEE